MHFLFRTDSGSRALPKALPATAPFFAKNELSTLSTLVATLEAALPIFPVNPRLPKLPEMPPKRAGIASFLFTSGSTAAPKIASHSFDNYLLSARGSLTALKLEEGDRWLLSLPLFHVGGLALLFRCALAKAEVVLSQLPLLEAITLHRITHLSLVPTQLYRLLQEDAKKIQQATASLKMVLLGGAPLPEQLLQKALELGLPIHPTYGLTEMSSLVTLDPLPGALPYRELKIAQDGELMVKGPTLFQGYLGDPPPIDEEGWFATRDLGKWSSRGTLEIIGRKDNLFISGGENIQPEEIESLLLALPDVVEAVVVPTPDPEYGMRPAVFLATGKRTYTLEELRERLRDHLPSFKLPISLYPLPEQPLGLKRSRKELAALSIYNLFSCKNRST